MQTPCWVRSDLSSLFVRLHKPEICIAGVAELLSTPTTGTCNAGIDECDPDHTKDIRAPKNNVEQALKFHSGLVTDIVLQLQVRLTCERARSSDRSPDSVFRPLPMVRRTQVSPLSTLLSLVCICSLRASKSHLRVTQ